MNVAMVSLDLKNAFFHSISNTVHQKYFEFEMLRNYKFIGKPNDYLDAIRIVTKNT